MEKFSELLKSWSEYNDNVFEVWRKDKIIGKFYGLHIEPEKYIIPQKGISVFQESDLLISNGGKKYTIKRIAHIAGATRLYY